MFVLGRVILRLVVLGRGGEEVAEHVLQDAASSSTRASRATVVVIR